MRLLLMLALVLPCKNPLVMASLIEKYTAAIKIPHSANKTD